MFVYNVKMENQQMVDTIILGHHLASFAQQEKLEKPPLYDVNYVNRDIITMIQAQYPVVKLGLPFI